MKRTLLLIALLAIVLPSHSQGLIEGDRLFYHAFRMPQSNSLNPALFPQRDLLYISLPGASATFRSPWCLSDVVHYDATQQVNVIDANRIFDTLYKDPNIFANANVDLLGFGIKLGDNYLTLSSRVVTYANLGIPYGLVRFATEGNITEQGVIDTLNLVNGDLFSLNSYAEIGIGLAHKFTAINLTVGARAKLLYGIANLQTVGSYVNLYTGTDCQSLTADMNYSLNLASAVPIDENFNPTIDMGRLLDLSNANLGLALDLGARLDLGPVTLSASVLDLSTGIKWKSNTYSLVPQNGQGSFTFSGVDITQAVQDATINVDTISSQFNDMLHNMRPERTEGEPYTSMIPLKMNAGASVKIIGMVRAGVLFQGQLDKSMAAAVSGDLNTQAQFRSNTTLSLGLNFLDHAELIVANSVVFDGSAKTFFNPGVGFYLGKNFQFYLMLNRISSIYLVEVRDVSLHTGFNILIGRDRRNRVKEAITDYTAMLNL